MNAGVRVCECVSVRVRVHVLGFARERVSICVECHAREHIYEDKFESLGEFRW